MLKDATQSHHFAPQTNVLFERTIAESSVKIRPNSYWRIEAWCWPLAACANPEGGWESAPPLPCKITFNRGSKQ